MDRRQCLIDDSIEGYFLGLANVETAYLKVDMLANEPHLHSLEQMFAERHILPFGCYLEKVAHVGAIVEHLDGTVEVISPVERIRFTDNQ